MSVDKSSNDDALPLRHIVIMGVSGCGKTTVAGILADRTGYALAEADDFHPAANVAKMASGHPLTDEDRWPWLQSLRDWMDQRAAENQCAIITCSALKRSYRDFLREGDAPVTFVHLCGSRELLEKRLAARTNHFMPAALLDSQLATLEPLQADEPGYSVGIAGTPSEICTNIMEKLGLKNQREGGAAQSQPDEAPRLDGPADADIGVYGLGVMGSSLARNLARHGNRVAVFNIDSDVTDKFIADYGDEGDFHPVETEAQFVAALRPPRVVALMVTAGAVTEEVTERLARLLSPGDIIVDMGNSHFQDTRRREAKLRERGINFVGCGTSGGEEGALLGPSLMVGGSKEAWERLEPLYTAIAAKAPDGKACCARVGSDGAGHFVKMVHNGIEYADMQLLSEVYSVLREAGMSTTQIGDIFEKWDEGALGSYLVQISAEILHHTDPDTGRAFLDIIDDVAGQKGTGAWTSIESFQLGVPTTTIAAATYARYTSSQTKVRSRVQDVFGVRTPKPAQTDLTQLVADLQDAVYAAKIVCYAQGLDLISTGAETYGWDIDLAEVAEIWRAGCIIRADFLDQVAAAYRQQAPGESLLVAPDFAEHLRGSDSAWERVIEFATRAGTPVPVLSAARDYLLSLRSERLGTALIQAQRDFFGAHTYHRVDKPGTFHTKWAQTPASEVQLD